VRKRGAFRATQLTTGEDQTNLDTEGRTGAGIRNRYRDRAAAPGVRWKGETPDRSFWNSRQRRWGGCGSSFSGQEALLQRKTGRLGAANPPAERLPAERRRVRDSDRHCSGRVLGGRHSRFHAHDSRRSHRNSRRRRWRQAGPQPLCGFVIKGYAASNARASTVRPWALSRSPLIHQLAKLGGRIPARFPPFSSMVSPRVVGDERARRSNLPSTSASMVHITDPADVEAAYRNPVAPRP